MEKHLVNISRRLSRILRHDPASIRITLEKGGWTSVEPLIQKLGITRETLDTIVQENDKKRFEYSPDGTRIRACQGHTVDVDLGYETSIPPEFLYHGTTANVVPVIRVQGLNKRKRHAVHMTVSKDTAESVGARHGQMVVVLKVRALEMHKAGHSFQVSTNGVWLVEHVPAQFID